MVQLAEAEAEVRAQSGNSLQPCRGPTPNVLVLTRRYCAYVLRRGCRLCLLEALVPLWSYTSLSGEDEHSCGVEAILGQCCKVSSSWKKRLSIEPLPTERTGAPRHTTWYLLPELESRAAGEIAARTRCRKKSSATRKGQQLALSTIRCVRTISAASSLSFSAWPSAICPSSRQNVRRKRSGVVTSVSSVFLEWKLPQLTLQLHFYSIPRTVLNLSCDS